MKHTKRCRGGIAIRTRFLVDARKYLTWRECRSCDTWLPLGPSNDTPAVLVEIRAAELADAWSAARSTSTDTSVHEDIGWLLGRDGVPEVPTTEGQQAGYLARVICDHDEERDLADAIEEFHCTTVTTPGESTP